MEERGESYLATRVLKNKTKSKVFDHYPRVTLGLRTVLIYTYNNSVLGRFLRVLYFEGFHLRAMDTFIQWISLSCQ